MDSIGIFGPKTCGKTNLAKYFSRQFWRWHERATLVLDPHRESWGPQALVTVDGEKFTEWIWNSRNYLVIMEEAAETIARDRDKTTLFTRLNHQGHKLIIIGHDGTDLLPVQRRQFDQLALFVQPKKATEIWLEDQPQIRGLEEAPNLKQYEFLWGQHWQTAQKRILPLSEVRARG